MVQLKKILAPVGVVLLLAAGVAFIWTDEFGTVPAILGGLGLAAFLGAILAYLDEVKKVMMTRRTKYASGAGFFIGLVLAVIVAINYVGVKRSWRLDLTESQLYSLTDKSQKLVAGLERDIRVLGFFQEGTPERKQSEDLLKEYQHAAKGRLSVEFIDPYKTPAKAKEHGVSVLGTLIFMSQAGQTKIEESNEEAITNAIVKVTTDKQSVIYFVKGHGEKDPEDSGENGYSQVKKALEDENFQVRGLPLIQQEKMPEDATAVVVAGPRLKYFDTELGRLQEYVNGGGRLLLLVDPESDGWKDFLKDWGVDTGPETIIDPLAKLLGADYTIPLVSQYGDHEITKNFKYATFFPTCRPLRTQGTPPSGVTLLKLAESTPQSWAESNISKPKLDAGDEKGPLAVAVVAHKSVESKGGGAEKKSEEAGEESKKEARLIVVGDSDFGSNAYVNLSANLNFLMNMVSWLSRREALISIREKTPGFRSVSLTTTQMRNITLLTLVFIPGLLIVAGIYTFLHRRNL